MDETIPDQQGNNSPDYSKDPKVYGQNEKTNIFKKVGNTVRDVISIMPTSVLTKYWSGGYRNIKPDYDVALEHKINIPDEELKNNIRTEVYENFKAITTVYAFHGKMTDLADDKAKYKLNSDERDYIGLKTDANGKITDFMNGSVIVGYLDDKSGARAIAIKSAEGKITISIAGGDMTAGKQSLAKDVNDIFAITAGNMTGQFKPVYDFAKSIEKEYGKVDVIAGHSLGAHIAVALVPAFQNTKIYAYDAPGVSNALEHNMSKFYGLSKDQLTSIYDKTAPDVLEIENGTNSFNSLGWMPRKVSLVDPEKDEYKVSKISSVMPTGHFYGGGYYQAIRDLKPSDEADMNEQKLFNATVTKGDRSNGPKVITAAEVGLTAVMATSGVGLILDGAGVLHGAIAHKRDNPKPLSDAEKQALFNNNSSLPLKPKENLTFCPD